MHSLGIRSIRLGANNTIILYIVKNSVITERATAFSNSFTISPWALVREAKTSVTVSHLPDRYLAVVFVPSEPFGRIPKAKEIEADVHQTPKGHRYDSSGGSHWQT